MFQQIILFRNSARGSQINEENRAAYKEEAKHELAKLIVWDFDLCLKHQDMETAKSSRKNFDALRQLRKKIRDQVQEVSNIKLSLDPDIQDRQLSDYIRITRIRRSAEENSYLMLVDEAQEYQDLKATHDENCRRFCMTCEGVFEKYEKVLPEDAYRFGNVTVYFYNNLNQ